MDFRKIILAGVVLVFSNWVSGQVDSTDLDFYSEPPVALTYDDSLMYSFGSFSELHLDFELSDSINFGKVFIEVGVLGNGGIFYRRNFTLTQLSDLNFIEGNQIEIILGVFEMSSGYRVSVVLENQNGLLSEVFTKTILP